MNDHYSKTLNFKSEKLAFNVAPTLFISNIIQNSFNLMKLTSNCHFWKQYEKEFLF
jgi:hypothetical protein